MIEESYVSFDTAKLLKEAGFEANTSPTYTNGDYDCIAIAEAFEHGAQWRINSVWHKPSAYGEELKRDVEVIAKTKRGYSFGKFGVVGYSNEYVGFVSTSRLEYALSDVLEYAYLDDLLPERKEEKK